ncbi:MAG: nitroreductase family protein [Nitrospirae bacterium]|nr:nitroreductase family protein [Nitrospirota bacterium]
MTEIPCIRWYEAAQKRRSRRSFNSSPIASDLLAKIDKVCKEFKPFHGIRAVVVSRSVDKVFKGIVGHYGKIRGATVFIAFIGDMNDPYIHEKAGYTGEGIILEATALNLGTCWVGASFNPAVASSSVQLRKNEKVLAVTPVGYAVEKVSFEEKIMTGFGRTHKRKSLFELVKGLEESKWPEWIKTALEAARIAPSAVNRQPWRFNIEPGSITISVDDLKDTYNIPKRLDCGIAMLHIEIAALYRGIRGKWEFLSPPQVARFVAQIPSDSAFA